MSESRSEPLVVCLGFPAYAAPAYLARLRAIHPCVEPIELPVDPDSDWVSAATGAPFDEPPPWGAGVAKPRLRALERAEVLVALHSPSDLMTLAPRLRWIQGIGAGVEQFAAAGVSAARVTVTNASGLSSASMAEFVIGRLLQIWKHFRAMDHHQREHAYVRSYGRTFKGSTVGIVGMGTIGTEVAVRARALGLCVLGMKRSYRSGDRSDHADELFGPDRLHEMLGRCDAVVVAAPATPDTEHLIDAAACAAMPKGSVLVNVARGSLVDEAALVESLQSGHLGAAALDVFEEEPLPAASPLWDLPTAYLSAHSSVSTDRYLDDVFDLFEENVTRYVAGETLRNGVEMTALGFA
jgi:phosphoglycerate dehydrogenase-like enzyme